MLGILTQSITARCATVPLDTEAAHRVPSSQVAMTVIGECRYATWIGFLRGSAVLVAKALRRTESVESTFMVFLIYVLI